MGISKPAVLKGSLLTMFHLLWEDIINWWNVKILYEGIFIRIRHTFNGAYLNSYITFIVNNTAGSMFLTIDGTGSLSTLEHSAVSKRCLLGAVGQSLLS